MVHTLYEEKVFCMSPVLHKANRCCDYFSGNDGAQSCRAWPRGTKSEKAKLKGCAGGTPTMFSRNSTLVYRDQRQQRKSLAITERLQNMNEHKQTSSLHMNGARCR